MGYCISFIDSTVRITKDDAKKIMEFLPKYIYNNNPNWKWIDIKDVCVNCNNGKFKKVMHCLRYVVQKTKDTYKITDFCGEKLGDDIDIFEILAPYIHKGYIEMQGEDGDSWRWIFDGDKVNEIPIGEIPHFFKRCVLTNKKVFFVSSKNYSRLSENGDYVQRLDINTKQKETKLFYVIPNSDGTVDYCINKEMLNNIIGTFQKQSNKT